MVQKEERDIRGAYGWVTESGAQQTARSFLFVAAEDRHKAQGVGKRKDKKEL